MVKGAPALVLGLVGAAILCGVGYFRNWEYDTRVADADARC